VTTTDKAKIIETIQQTDDERILFSISRLLQIKEEIPVWQKNELDRRNKRIDSGTEELYDWDEIIEKIANLIDGMEN
jgi:hypothetical protein